MGLGSVRQALLTALGLAVLTAPICRGQAKAAGTGPGSLVTIGGTVSGFKLDYGQRYLGGAGAFVDLNPSWRYGIEGEARFFRYHQENDTHFSTYLAGPRISLRPHRLNPYVKVLAGLGHFNFPYDYAYGNYLVIAPGAGVDLRLNAIRGLNRRVTLRLIDFEYQEWPKFTFGAIHPYGVSAGISFSVLRSGTKQGD